MTTVVPLPVDFINVTSLELLSSNQVSAIYGIAESPYNDSSLVDDQTSASTTSATTFFHQYFTTADSKSLQAVSLSVLDLLCLLENSVLIVTIYRCVELRTVSNFLILNLASIGVLLSLVVLPAWIITTLTDLLVLGESACRTIGMIMLMLFLEAILTLGGVALDRFGSICHPFRYPLLADRQRAVVFLLLTWLVSVVLSAMPLLGFGRYGFRLSEVPLCAMDFGHEPAFSVLPLALVVCPSCLTIFFCYWKIFSVARSQARKVHNLETSLAQNLGIHGGGGVSGTNDGVVGKNNGVSVNNNGTLGTSGVLGNKSGAPGTSNSGVPGHNNGKLGTSAVPGNKGSAPGTSNGGVLGNNNSTSGTCGVLGNKRSAPATSNGGVLGNNKGTQGTCGVLGKKDTAPGTSNGGVLDNNNGTPGTCSVLGNKSGTLGTSNSGTPDNNNGVPGKSDVPETSYNGTLGTRRQTNNNNNGMPDNSSEMINKHASPLPLPLPIPPPPPRPQNKLWQLVRWNIRKSVRETRAFRTVFTIIFCFLTCWSPYIALVVYAISTDYKPSFALEFAFTFLALANYVANPLICVLMNREFRRGMRKVFRSHRKLLLEEVVSAWVSQAAELSRARRELTRTQTATSPGRKPGSGTALPAGE